MKIRSLVVVGMMFAVVSNAHAQTRANPVRIMVDGSEWPRGILHAQLSIPASPGPMTLYFPKWIPGTHRPEGNIADLAGLFMRANGQPVPWVRDTLDNYTLHVNVPAGARTLDVRLDALNAATATNIGFLEWNTIVLYPAGRPVSQLYYKASLRLPPGWKCSCAVDSTGASSDGIEYATVSLEELVDSPVMAGVHVRRLALQSSFGARVEADIFCTSPEGLDFKPEFTDKMNALVREAGALFGARHFNHYQFLIGLGDLPGELTLEHHQCQAYGAKERDLLELGSTPLGLSDLGHEFGHSWCGKYRRPVGLAFTDYQHPENAELLWVYEGLDQYLGYVLNGRSGMFSAESARLQFIRSAASLAYRSGRKWRPIRDTAIDTGPLRDASNAWFFWRRGQDYYIEGAMIWLEADAVIRRLSGGKKSLDDFCRLFLGGGNTGPEVMPYSEDQVVSALNAVQPFEWRRFLDDRINGIDTSEPTRALESTGWRLVFGDTLSDYDRASEALSESVNLTYSLGIFMKGDGSIRDVRPDGPSGKAGLAPGMKLIGVNGRTYSKSVLLDALKSARKSDRPMELLVTWGDAYRTFKVDCRTGPQYPAGERIKAQPDYLSQILNAKTPAPPAKRP